MEAGDVGLLAGALFRFITKSRRGRGQGRSDCRIIERYCQGRNRDFPLGRRGASRRSRSAPVSSGRPHFARVLTSAQQER